jgi:mono/diheme cytochrome c family protein
LSRYRLLGATAAATLIAAIIAGAPARHFARADEAHGESEDGMRIYKAANCVGCHKWDGQGGGGYGGAAANLRQTQLDYDAIVMTITCGRPGTGMPHFQENAYDDGHCYGLKEGDIPPDQKVAAPAKWLRKSDIDTVAHYVVDDLKGKGAPTYSQCQAFFGTESRVCETYPHAGGGGHLKIEAAPDNNAGSTQ